MQIIILVIGVIAIMSAINGTVPTLGKQVSNDLFGSGDSKDYGFIVWAGAIILLAMTMRAIDLPIAGKYLLTLILLAFALENQGLLDSLLTQLKSIHASGAAGTTGSSQPLSSPLMGG